MGVELFAAAACLDDDHADRVGDHVVQFASDSYPLLGDGRARTFLAFPFEHDGSFFEKLLALAAGPNEASYDERREDDDAEEDEPTEIETVRVGRGDEDPQRDR